LQKSISVIKKQQLKLENEVQFQTREIEQLKGSNATNVNTIKQLDSSTNNKFQSTQSTITTNKANVEKTIHNNGLIVFVFIVILLLVIICAYFLLHRRIKSSYSDMATIKKTQDEIKKAQDTLKEESVKLDNDLLDVLNKQIEIFSKKQSNIQQMGESQKEPDHSLVLKIADEITRIEINLSRMDNSIRGYKQLAKAVERIKDNFLAQGYEIVDMLGKTYNDGMKVIANFIPNENLNEGEQIITGIIKPQINYNGKMIQAAEITVSQNI
jgi:hypothetical protein